MSTLLIAYWICFGGGLAWVLLAGALGAISHGFAGVHDTEQADPAARVVHSERDFRYNPFTLLSLMGTLAGFGGGGLVGANVGLKLLGSVACAVLGAGVAAILLWLIIGKLLYKLHLHSSDHISDMIGLEAEVLTPVEPDSSGEIAYVLDGTRYTAPARLMHSGVAVRSSKVRIRRVGDSLVYVEEQQEPAA